MIVRAICGLPPSDAQADWRAGMWIRLYGSAGRQDPENRTASVKPVLDAFTSNGWIFDDDEQHLELAVDGAKTRDDSPPAGTKMVVWLRRDLRYAIDGSEPRGAVVDNLGREERERKEAEAQLVVSARASLGTAAPHFESILESGGRELAELVRPLTLISLGDLYAIATLPSTDDAIYTLRVRYLPLAPPPIVRAGVQAFRATVAIASGARLL